MLDEEGAARADALEPRRKVEPLRRRERKGAPDTAHRFGKNQKRRCNTDTRGYPTPENRDPRSLVLDASDGFIPLWEEGMTLRWRFHDASIEAYFEDQTAAKAEIRSMLTDALLGWGNAAPVKFTEQADGWDFQVRIQQDDDCDGGGCVLAEAFFPDAGRHNLILYPVLMGLSRAERVETLAHEFGHIFGLRHFFAQAKEAGAPSVLFGEQDHFTIMNYGSESVLTEVDRHDLRTLYDQVWSGQLKKIAGTRIVQVRPYHLLG